MKLDQLEHLPLADGDILKLPSGTDEAVMRQIAHAITRLHPGKRILLLACDIEKVACTDMAEAGWVRCEPATLH